MQHKLTTEDARESLTAHVAAKGAEIRAKYGPTIGWSQLQAILADPGCVRYPCELEFEDLVERGDDGLGLFGIEG